MMNRKLVIIVVLALLLCVTVPTAVTAKPQKGASNAPFYVYTDASMTAARASTGSLMPLTFWQYGGAAEGTAQAAGSMLKLESYSYPGVWARLGSVIYSNPQNYDQLKDKHITLTVALRYRSYVPFMEGTNTIEVRVAPLNDPGTYDPLVEAQAMSQAGDITGGEIISGNVTLQISTYFDYYGDYGEHQLTFGRLFGYGGPVVIFISASSDAYGVDSNAWLTAQVTQMKIQFTN